MATADRLRGRVLTGHTIPYGTLAGASLELKIAYYQFGYLHDKDMPELPVYEPPAVEVDLEETVLQAERARILGDILDGLTPREAKILRLRYGIGIYADYTLDEVGQMFDVTRERIRQIEAKAMRRLKHPMRREMFRYLLASFASW